MEPETPIPTEQPAQTIPPWLQKIYDQMGGDAGYMMTDDDLMILSQYMLMQQMQSGMGQMDLANGQLDYQNRVLDLSELELEQKYAEFEFLKNEYTPWYQGDYFDFIQQQEANKMAMSNNQLGMSNNQLEMSEHDVTKSMNYALASKEQTRQAGYGADAAKYQYLVSIGALSDPNEQRGGQGLTPMARDAYGY